MEHPYWNGNLDPPDACEYAYLSYSLGSLDSCDGHEIIGGGSTVYSSSETTHLSFYATPDGGVSDDENGSLPIEQLLSVLRITEEQLAQASKGDDDHG